MTGYPSCAGIAAVAVAWAAACVMTAGCASSFPVDGERALERVRHQVEAGPRIPGTPGHAAIREWLESETARLGGRVESHSFVDSTLGRPIELTNVIGRWGPEAGMKIVLLAHWDTRPFADRDPDPARRSEPVPGANDGGSGVAVLLEVAELMRTRAPRVPVELVFLDGEDQGEATREDQFCLGSRAYAARAERGTIRGAFVFDMVGDRDLNIYPEVYSARRAANLVAVVLQGARATGARGFHSEPRYAVFDDHIPLLDAGIPAVDVIDFDYPAWHTTRDGLDQVSAQSLAEVAKVAAWLVYQSPLAQP